MEKLALILYYAYPDSCAHLISCQLPFNPHFMHILYKNSIETYRDPPRYLNIMCISACCSLTDFFHL